jgi:hypothetical protein
MRIGSAAFVVIAASFALLSGGDGRVVAADANTENTSAAQDAALKELTGKVANVLPKGWSVQTKDGSLVVQRAEGVRMVNLINSQIVLPPVNMDRHRFNHSVVMAYAITVRLCEGMTAEKTAEIRRRNAEARPSREELQWVMSHSKSPWVPETEAEKLLLEEYRRIAALYRYVPALHYGDFGAFVTADDDGPLEFYSGADAEECGRVKAAVKSCLEQYDPRVTGTTFAPDAKREGLLATLLKDYLSWRPPTGVKDAANPFRETLLKEQPDIVTVIVATYKDDAAPLPVSLIWTLGEMGSPDVFHLLLREYKARPEPRAAVSLGACLNRDNISYLCNAFHDDDTGLRAVLEQIYRPRWADLKALPTDKILADLRTNFAAVKLDCMERSKPQLG